MHIALLTAGGNGTRMHQDIPKQFIHVDNQPVIIYTLQAFEHHPNIDAICVVCLDGWHDVLWAYAKPVSYTHLDVYKRQMQPHLLVLFHPRGGDATKRAGPVRRDPVPFALWGPQRV